MRCMCCMREIEENSLICNFCRFPQDTPPENPDALTPGTELRNRFILGVELGRGGFGITYVGYDKYLDCKVAIKEYYPKNIAVRIPGGTKPMWESLELRDAGCQTVIREAQKMHKLGILPAAVHVLDVFYENDTVYIAMDYIEGITLKKYLLKNDVLPPKKCIELMLPILDTMIQMHKAGIIHRDISPDNIMIQPDVTPRILDLGAAKDIHLESGYTSLVARRGFSPVEQYQTNGRIGPWTDVYSLCATMYYSLTGRVPPTALDRLNIDDKIPFVNAQHIPLKLRQVLLDGMQMSIANRIPNMSELKERLIDSLIPEAPKDAPPKPAPYVPDPALSHSVVTVEHPSVPEGSKSTGFFPSLFTKMGKKKKSPINSNAKSVTRNPSSITVSSFNASPIYTDPDCTLCQGIADEEQTVLFDEAQPVPARATLVQARTGKRIDITKCCFVLGRLTSGVSPLVSADCLIEDSAKHISRRHAAILFDGEAFFLQDISARNITRLNGVRIQNDIMPENSNVFSAAYRLYDGDCIQLADEVFTFHLGGSL